VGSRGEDSDVPYLRSKTALQVPHARSSCGPFVGPGAERPSKVSDGAGVGSPKRKVNGALLGIGEVDGVKHRPASTKQIKRVAKKRRGSEMKC